jgi:hypothetical protein
VTPARHRRTTEPAGLVSVVLLAIMLLLVVGWAVATARAASWKRGYVTGYSTRENLTGCYAPGRCRTACGTLLDDRAYTVAANPRHGLGCGQRIVVCGRSRAFPGTRERCHRATVTDRTASYFDFELTIALACATGARCAYPAFADPRWITWRKR